MGQLVAAGAINERVVIETLGAADGGLDYPATRKTIASGLAAGKQTARAVPGPSNPAASVFREPRVEDVPPWELETLYVVRLRSACRHLHGLACRRSDHDWRDLAYVAFRGFDLVPVKRCERCGDLVDWR